ncbi:MAG: DUF3078 domain-containing protein [Chitinophagaceae bacterium]
MPSKFYQVAVGLILFIRPALGQDSLKGLSTIVLSEIKPTAGDSVRSWKTGGLFNLNISQGSQSNWAAGGDNFSFAAHSLLNAFAHYSRGKNIWDNTLSMSYGYLTTTSLGTRKSDDQFDLNSRYGYLEAKSWYYTGLLDFRSQFSRG